MKRKQTRATVEAAHQQMEELSRAVAELAPPQQALIKKPLEDLRTVLEELDGAQDRLTTSEEQYRTLTESMNEGLMRVDEEGRVLFVNDRFCKLLGYDREELLGTLCYKLLLFEEDWPAYISRRADRKAGLSETYTIRMRKKTGEAIWVQKSGSPIGETGDLPAGSVGLVTDITERVQAERVLVDSELKYRSIYQEMRDGFFRVTMDGRISESNEAYCSLTGYSADELKEHTYVELTPEKWRDMEKRIVETRIMSAGDSGLYEKEYRRKDGTIVPVELRAYLDRAQEGKPSSMWAIVRDITERMRALRLERALYDIARESEMATTVDDLLRSVHKIIKGLMPAENFYVALYDEKTDLLSLPYFVDEVDLPSPPEKLGKGLTAYVLRTGRALLCNAPLSQELIRREEVDMVGVPSACWLGVPLKTEDRTIGAMVLQHYSDPAAYGEREAQVLEDVSGQVANAIEHKRVQETLAESERFARATLDALSAHICVLDETGRILAVNKAWREFAGMNGLAQPNAAVGANYLQACDAATGPDAGAATAMAEGIRASVGTGRDPSPVEYPCHSRSERRWFLGRVTRFPGGGPVRVVVAHEDITPRKLAEEALRESEVRYREIFENSSECIFLLDVTPDGRFKLAGLNPAEERVVGLSAADVSGKFVEEVFPAELAAQITANYSRCVEAEAPVTYEEELDLSIGPRFFHTTLIPVRNADGQVYRIVGVAQDTTEKRLAEEALRKGEEKFRDMVESINDVIYMTDEKGVFSYISPTVERLSDFTPSDIVGHSFLEFVHPEDRPSVVQKLGQVLGGQLAPSEYRFLTKSGQVRWCRSSSRPVYENGRAIGLRGVMHDVTERKLAAEALRKSEASLHTLVQNIPDLIWLKDADGVYLSCNPQFERFVGAREADVRGKTDYDLVNRELADFFRANDRKAMAAGKPTVNEEWITFADDGRRAMLETIKTPMVDSEGRLIGVLGIGRDITERKRAEEEILRLNAELKVHVQQRTSELVATTAELDGISYSVSHDLRAPLRSIDGWSAALIEDYGDKLDPTGRGYLETVRAEANHMGQLIDGLLQISKATRREMGRERLDLGEIARAVAVGLARESGERDVKFVIAEEAVAEGDPHLLRIALQSLMQNALKFTRVRDHAVIEFGVTEREGVPAFFVRDNGVGFDPKFAHKLFQPFQRLHPKEEYPGSAIGLATVQRVIHRHGGKVWAEGEVGKGATFTFTLRPPKGEGAGEGSRG